jgi:hypothetical protein
MRTSTDKTTPDKGPGKRRLALGRAPRTRSVVLATGMLVIGISPFAIAATGDALREGKRNGTTTSETEIIANIKSSTGLKGGYGTRQSNLSSSGGGAIYGCRSQEGGSGAKPTPQNPCIRANNLSKGLAFEFNASNGDIAGAITVGAGGDSKKPFVTNATGIATGLNADRLDGANLSEILSATTAIAAKAAADGSNAAKTRWFLLDEKGAIVEQSGGFTVIDAYDTNQNAYIDSGEELADNGLGATISIQNLVDVDGAEGADPNFQGEVSVSRCQIPNVVECAPAGSKNTKALVVSPRDSDGEPTTATTRKRVYVTVTGTGVPAP